MDLSAELRTFLEEEDAKQHKWGECDCTFTPGKWLARIGFDVRFGSYRTEEEARAIIAQHGSLVGVWERHLDRANIFERFDEPRLGDVAIIDTHSAGQIGCIVAHGRIAAVRRNATREGEGGFAWIGPVRNFVKVWAAS